MKDILSKSAVSIDLKVNLTKHVNSMIWWLSHPEMVSIQDIFETSGSAILIAQQMKERHPDENASDINPSSIAQLYELIFKMATKLGKIVGLANRGIETANQLSGGVQHLLETINPPT